MRPSSGDTYVRELLHCVLIRCNSLLLLSFHFWCFYSSCFFFFVVRLSSAMYNMYFINTLHYSCLITFLCICMLYFCTYVFWWCARDCMFQVCLCIHCIDFWCNCSCLHISVSIKCAAIYRKAHVPFEIWNYTLR
jgi:hypothetical protein